MMNNGPRTVSTLALACGSLLMVGGGEVNAAGFQLIEQSVSGMGTAYAGTAAIAEDASTVYFNPAGLTELKSPKQAILGLHLVRPQAEFNDEASSHLLLGPGGLGTGDGGDAGVLGTVPNLYYAHPINEKVFFGLGINVPFGLATEYSRDWVGRYHAVKSELHTVNINPAIAIKLNEKASFGFGINAQYIDAEVTNAIDIGTINALPQAAGGFGGAFNALGLVPGASDGFAKLEGDDWSWGYNLGFLFELGDQTRLGLHYRSKIRHTLEGDADFTVPGGGVIEAGTGLFTDGDVKSTAELPASATISLFHQLSKEWSLMADFSWTDWSQLHELRFEFDSPQPDGVTTLEWDDSYRYAVGATYAPEGGKFIYRAGLAFDETPIPNSHMRTPRIPGEDRTWLAIGLGYKHSKQLSFDFGYAHLFVREPKIRKSASGEDAIKGGLYGDYDASTDILSAQVVWSYE